MNIQLQNIEALLDRIKAIPKMDPRERTIFEIGSRGYYENPTTDILAFFVDNNAEHGLKALLKKKPFLSCCHRQEVFRLNTLRGLA